MTDPDTTILQTSDESISQLASQFQAESEKNQLQIIPRLVNLGEAGLDILIDFLLSTQGTSVNLVRGKAYQALYQANLPKIQDFLQAHFPTGVVPLNSDRHIDYRLLQQLLAQGDFQTADSLTRQKLCELAGEAAMQRKWLYFTEVEQFPSTDLYTIDSLWWVHSEGKFGFSVQRKIWLSVGQDFPKLWPKINWKNGNNWTQYPNEFIWDLSAPAGHLPLLNQLRGVRVAASLYTHPVWTQRDNRD
jgi:GUN4-like/ARM-like repeat domain, GUN4-N terminal